MSTISRVKLNNPGVLAWARTEMGLSPSDVARTLNKTDKHILAWESGTDAPTYRQLEKLARKLKRPLAAFFLPSVPPAASLPADYRLVPGREESAYQPESRLAFRQVRNMLGSVRQLSDDLGEPLAFSLPRWTVQDKPERMAGILREALGATMEAQLSLRDHRAALDYWRSLLFDRGTVVRICRMPIGDVRAFCVSQDGLAGIGLSNEDHDHGRIFSLFHEVAHLGLGVPGASALLTRDSPAGDPSYRLEQYCDHFAAAVLMPPAEGSVSAALRHLSRDLTLEAATAVAKRFKVSKYVAVRRALDLGHIDADTYWRAVTAWRVQDAKLEVLRREQRKSGRDTKVNRNVVQMSYVGKRFTSLVSRALVRGVVSNAEAAGLVGIGEAAAEELL